MPKRIISEISDEQQTMLPSYREKWRSFELSTEPIDEEKVASVIKAAYSVSDFPQPEIWFYESPFAAIQEMIAIDNFKAYLGRDIHIKFLNRVVNHLLHEIEKQLDKNLFTKLRNKIHYPDFPHYWTEDNPIISYFPHSLSSCIDNQLIDDFHQYGIDLTYCSNLRMNLTRTAKWAIWGCMFDFCISVLGVGHDKKKWQVVQDLIQHCGFIFQFEKVCISCVKRSSTEGNRAFKLSFDTENRLHGEGEPAIKFRDGYSVYAFHGKHPSDEY